MTASTAFLAYDLKDAASKNRVIGLWRLMTGFRRVYLGATVSLGIGAIAHTFMLLLLAYFVDNVLGKPADGALTIPLYALGFVALALVEGSFTFYSGRLAARTAEGITRRVRNYVFDHVQRLPFSYFDKAQTGDLIQRSTSDVDAVRRFFADQAIGLGRIFLLFGINFTALLSLHVGLAVFSVLCVPLIIVMSLFFFRRVSKAYEKYQEQDGKVSTVLQENLSGVRVVKAFARQDHEEARFGAKANELREGTLVVMRAWAWYSPTMEFVSSPPRA